MCDARFHDLFLSSIVFGSPSLVLLATTVFGFLCRYGGQARPTGRVQLLTHLAYLGYCFNPVSFYYCLDASEEEIETVVAEVRLFLVFVPLSFMFFVDVRLMVKRGWVAFVRSGVRK